MSLGVARVKDVSQRDRHESHLHVADVGRPSAPAPLSNAPSHGVERSNDAVLEGPREPGLRGGAAPDLGEDGARNDDVCAAEGRVPQGPPTSCQPTPGPAIAGLCA